MPPKTPKNSKVGKIKFHNNTAKGTIKPGGQTVVLTLRTQGETREIPIKPGQDFYYEPKDGKLALLAKPEVKGMIAAELTIKNPVKKKGDRSIYIQEIPGHNAFALEFHEIW
jgi:hypothetical protein